MFNNGTSFVLFSTKPLVFFPAEEKEIHILSTYLLMDQTLIRAFSTLPTGIAENVHMGLKNQLVTRFQILAVYPFTVLPPHRHGGPRVEK